MKTVALMLVISLMLAACKVTLTHVHPDFGPHYGDGPGGG